jgi:ribonuclease VapC
MKAVLDASALLAYLQNELGSDAVEAMLTESIISSVNWAEVVQKSIAAGVSVDGMRDDLEALGLIVSPFTLEEAEIARRLWQQNR